MENQQEEKRERKGGWIWLLLLLLLSSIGMNIYLFMSTEAKEQRLNKEMVSSAELKKDLEGQLEKIRSERDDFKGLSAEKEEEIKKKDAELEARAQKIALLLKDNKMTYNQYIDAKDEIDKWKYDAGVFMKERDQLREENKKLSAENKDLNAEVTKNKKDIDHLTDENITFKNKVALGEQLKAPNMQITGIRMRSSGKEKETNRATQIEKIKICFDVPENHVADNGNRDIYIKVNDPSGQPVVIQSLGSGTFTYLGAESSYTTKDQIFYDNAPKNFCIYWGFAKDAHLKEGTYTIELYTEGYKMGEKNFTVK